MITPKQAAKVLNIGDIVYIAARTATGREVHPARVLAIEPLGVDTDVDFLPYDEHLGRWWLTEVVAKEAVKGARYEARAV